MRSDYVCKGAKLRRGAPPQFFKASQECLQQKIDVTVDLQGLDFTDLTHAELYIIFLSVINSFYQYLSKIKRPKM